MEYQHNHFYCTFTKIDVRRRYESTLAQDKKNVNITIKFMMRKKYFFFKNEKGLKNNKEIVVL